MKKKLYYLRPLVLLSCAIHLLTALDIWNLFSPSTYILLGILLFLSAVLGIFSPSTKMFDYFLTAIMPLSMCFVMFMAGFTESGECFSRFDWTHASHIAFQETALYAYALMAVTSFVFSFRKFRVNRR